MRKLAERLTNADIPDLNSGLRAFGRPVALPYLKLLPPGFSCVTTITLAFLSNGHEARYSPAPFPTLGRISPKHGDPATRQRRDRLAGSMCEDAGHPDR